MGVGARTLRYPLRRAGHLSGGRAFARTLPSILKVGREGVLVQLSVRRCAEVRGDDSSEDLCGHGSVDVEVRFYVPGGGGYPGAEDDTVDEGDASEGHTFEQVGAQGDRAPDIVAGYRGRLEFPGLYQLGEHS